ncbi:MAG TPA: MBL fold metallo-hydrolase [Terriglobales bacterium]|nr:MBL fold metallo-hydrolase [Terriglobales bacterium]
MHRLTLGDFELTIVSDGTYYLDGGAFFGIIPKVMWERKVKADEKNRVVTGLNSVLIRGGKKTVLIETGIGNKVPEKMAKIYAPQAKLLENLHAAGAAPEDIDLVINTHLHFDHCGWNTVREGDRVRATFPNAKYYVQEGEWRHGVEQHIRDRVSYISDNYDPLIKNGQMELLNGGREIVPGISVKVYPGHTRHMQAVMIESGGQKACYISDLIPTAAHLDIVWVMSYDLFPLDTIENKQRFYDEAVPQKWLVIFTHDHFTPWAYIEREGEKITAKPVAEAVPAD